MPEARVIPLRPDDDEPYVPPAASPGWEDQLADGLEFLRRRLTGDYETDEFGFDPDLTDHVLLPILRPLFEKWFRVGGVAGSVSDRLRPAPQAPGLRAVQDA